jgi:hypothetical protein
MLTKRILARDPIKTFEETNSSNSSKLVAYPIVRRPWSAEFVDAFVSIDC